MSNRSVVPLEAGADDGSRDGRALEIASIETIAMVAPLAMEFRGSTYRMTQRATLIVRIHTVDGIVGEAYVGDEDTALGQIEAIVRNELTPVLVGQDAMATERCWRSCYPVTYDILRDRRLGLIALAAVDTAIWDAVGKALGQPLWQLWGGSRNRIPMIAIGGYYGEPLGSISDEMSAYRELGLAGVKFKVGGLTPEADAARVVEARETTNDDFIIAIDANQGYSVADAVELAHRLDGVGVRWFEEPVRWHNDRRDMRDVRLQGGIPVCAGQSELSPSGCRDLMEAGSIDVCNFDASWSGGPTAWRRTAAIALAYNVEMGHHEEPQVATHLVASQPHGTYAECFHPDRDPFWWNLIANRPALEDGQLTLSNAPGLGWQLDWDYVARHRVSTD
jgi:L-alanine-DL-glutamate epimerase-like enolase superfamily enzyme